MNSFDPYREWLGITSHRKPTYYQLIGVSPSEEDATIIRQSAVKRLEQLNQVDDPLHETHKQKLIQRVRRAAKCLMNDELRIAYDRKLLAKNESEESNLTQDSPISVASSSSADGFDPVTVMELDTPTTGNVSRKYRSKQRKSNGLFLYGTLALISLCGISFLVVTQTPWGHSLLGDRAENSKENPKAAESFAENAEPLPMNAPDFEQEVETNEPNDNSSVDVSSLEERSMIATREPQPTLDEIRELQDALRSARAALENRDTVRATSTLKVVEKLAMRKEHRAKYDRLVSLAYYVREYWNALDDAVAELKSGQEIVVGANRMIVVELNDLELVVRVSGKNRTLQRDNLPLAMEIALADKGFSRKAASSKVFRGAMMAVSDQYETEEVRDLWRRAKAEGADIGDLELVLEDNYDLVNEVEK